MLPDVDLGWLLIALPAAFALGWIASRFDLRQVRRDGRSTPRAYFRGLTLLLNEQHDKAIDAFIEAVQHDADTAELHFGLGNLFRRRGDFERAVRVHQHLLDRGDLKAAERQRAQHELAQDFMKAGLFDRAQAAYRQLEGTPFDREARLALLTLHERARDWAAATATAAELERRGAGSFASRIAHYACEMAQEADARGQPDEAEAALARARDADPTGLRPALLAAQRLARAGAHDRAVQAYAELLAAHPSAWPLAAQDFARSAAACGRQREARAQLDRVYGGEPDHDLLQARLLLAADDAERARLAQDHLQQRPGPVAAARVLEWPPAAWDAATPVRLRDVAAAAAKPLQRYRCAACGFETHHHFWQCLRCHGWDSFPPRRIETP